MILLLDHSTPHGQVALADADADRLVDTFPIPPRKRHNVDLMVAVAELCGKHDVRPADLAAVSLTLGPGSFTGLRVAVATAKMLALASPQPDFQVVGVPNLDLLHRQHPGALIALNIKRGTAWSVGPDELDLPPAFRPLDEIQNLAAQHDLPIVAEKLDGAIPPQPDLQTLLDLVHAEAPGPSTLHRDPLTLAPAYLREPEAVTLWNEREDQENPAKP
ncbi:MAG: tRNA (adenosine(37)-N6)-threonylcarbamoyltransferase complex dimerization subunit type 1 TsaB [Planctomycetota bacterium]